MTDLDLTRALAERVMGWRVYGYAAHDDWVGATNHGRAAGTCCIDGRGRVMITDDAAVTVRLWRPLESMDDVWMAINKLQADGWHYEVGAHIYKPNSYWARFGKGDYDDDNNEWSTQHWGLAPTPQRAIALAALSVVGVEIREDHNAK